MHGPAQAGQVQAGTSACMGNHSHPCQDDPRTKSWSSTAARARDKYKRVSHSHFYKRWCPAETGGLIRRPHAIHATNIKAIGQRLVGAHRAKRFHGHDPAVGKGAVEFNDVGGSRRNVAHRVTVETAVVIHVLKVFWVHRPIYLTKLSARASFCQCRPASTSCSSPTTCPSSSSSRWAPVLSPWHSTCRRSSLQKISLGSPQASCPAMPCCKMKTMERPRTAVPVASRKARHRVPAAFGCMACGCKCRSALRRGKRCTCPCP